LTVLTFDLAARSLGDGDPTGLVADGDTVYANGPSLYVATDSRWRTGPMLRRGGQAIRTDEQTEVYKFDISASGRPRYVAGGAVPGWLINQYAMSEWDGRLRMATTFRQQTESSVYVLDGSLRQVGHVGGLGKGERIHSVRFVGTTGYVVTFRQTDPLYVVDLRDAAQPRVTGELKINGYSAYLHPAGNGRLIGVGQDADDSGRRNGLQVSLFDVADPTRPTRVAQYAVPGGYTDAELDPHAFLYWPTTGLLVVPVVTPGDPVRTADLADALALRLSGSSITAVGKIPGPLGGRVRRSLMIGDVLWTISDTTVTAYHGDSLTKLAEL
ncbi:MAG TPA: beta-propeller domain-containing protein, partial [Planosporangium sp.]|nr:beta-propeller domain-containing protein [Planosporangium sp.]